MAECYMCEEEGTTVEHVPPKCVFPEKKDLPEGWDLRSQLITVPACDEHNTKKSKDDEYILYVLVMNLPANEVGGNHFQTKLMRSIERNPDLIKQFLSTHQRVAIQDTETGEWQNTIAIEIDRHRFDGAIDMMSRALHYEHFSEKWLGKVSIQPDFLLSLDPETARDTNEPIEQLAEAADQIFESQPYFGENKEVFKYQVINGNDKCEKIMRLSFYGNCKVTVFFGLNG